MIIPFCICFFGFLFTLIYAVKKISTTLILCRYKYEDIFSLFDKFLSMTYDTIYESDLIAYIANGDNVIPKKERETLERNFIKQCILYMGKNNYEILLNFYGNEQTIIVNMIRYMRKRINEDGLSKIIREEEKQIQK